MSEIPSDSRRSSADQTELEKLLRSSKPWFEENATTLIYALAAVLAVAAVLVYMNRTPSGNVAASSDLLVARSPEDFGDVADTYPETDIGVWSRLRQADRLLDDAVTNMFKDRERGLEDLDRAEAAYDQLATQTDLSDEIRERVLIGIARLAETRCNGNQETTDTAVAAWQRVLDEFENSLVKDHAESRIAKLPTEESKAFYKWFSEQNPKPALTGQTPGQPAVPGVPNASSLTLPDFSDDKADDTNEKNENNDKADTSPTDQPEESPEEKPETADKDATAKSESSDAEKESSEPGKDNSASEKPAEKTPAEPEPSGETGTDAKSDDAKSDDAKSDDAKSDDVKTDDVKSDDVKSDDAKSDDVKSDDVKSDEAGGEKTPAEDSDK